MQYINGGRVIGTHCSARDLSSKVLATTGDPLRRTLMPSAFTTIDDRSHNNPPFPHYEKSVPRLSQRVYRGISNVTESDVK